MDSCFILVRTHQHGIAFVKRVLWSWHLKGCFSSASTVTGILHRALESYEVPEGYAMLMSPSKDETHVHGCHCPVIWLCACVRYCRVCPLLFSFVVECYSRDFHWHWPTLRQGFNDFNHPKSHTKIIKKRVLKRVDEKNKLAAIPSFYIAKAREGIQP